MNAKVLEYEDRPHGGEWQDVPADRVSMFCLNSCGGGYNERQTAESMVMLGKINRGETYKASSGLQIRLKEVGNEQS